MDMKQSGINFQNMGTNGSATPIYRGSPFTKMTENVYNHKLIESLKRKRNRSTLREHSYILRLGEKGVSE